MFGIWKIIDCEGLVGGLADEASLRGGR